MPSHRYSRSHFSCLSERLNVFLQVTCKEVSLPQLFCLPTAVFLFLFYFTRWHLASQPLTYLRIGGEGAGAGWGAAFQDIKVNQVVPLVGGLEEPALSAYQQSQALSREVGVRWGLGAGLGSDCPEWKQTPTPNQTQIEIPGGTGCPKLSQAMLGQGGRGQTMNSSSSPRGVRFPGLC